MKAARQFKNEVYYGDASRFDIVKSAGGADAHIFVLAIDDVAKSLETAKMVREHFPHLKIIARARHRRHAMDLLNLDIQLVHREVYLSGLEVVKDILKLKEEDESDIHIRLNKFRKYDEEVLRKHKHLADSDEKYISFVHQANQDLLKILAEDQKNTSRSLMTKED